ncbi:MAG: hypothetical protein JNG86_17395 [Verrucomicrobiaceae bacterium]|nr:hypothetical protein [Verrucomicrobiaceae bacterium]
MKTSFLPLLPRFAFAPVLSLLMLGAASQAFSADTHDFGDLPAPYATLLPNGARHVIVPGLKIGHALDAELDGQPQATAGGDDASGSDEDGWIATTETATAGHSHTRQVRVTNTTAANAFLHAFVDWNQDGDFADAAEHLVSVVPPNSIDMLAELAWSVPLNLGFNTQCAARLRLSSAHALEADGPAPDGEVEDSFIPVRRLYDFGDLPDFEPGTSAGTWGTTNFPDYRTRLSDGGPSHVIREGLALGSSSSTVPLVDAEADGQPAADAQGDDSSGVDDETRYEVHGTDELILARRDLDDGQGRVLVLELRRRIAAQNRTGQAAYLTSFADMNGDGDFSDPQEVMVHEVPSIPEGAVAPAWPLRHRVRVTLADLGGQLTITRTIAMRTRLSTLQGLGPDGVAPDGEVEDDVRTWAVDVMHDYGDLPAPYPTLFEENGATHVTLGQFDNVKLGAEAPDADDDGAPHMLAQGDDAGGDDDEDALPFTIAAMTGMPTSLRVPVDAQRPGTYTVAGFIDWNADGDFHDIGELAYVRQEIPEGGSSSPVLTWQVPQDAQLFHQLAIRLRVSSQHFTSPTGWLPDGEVEDGFFYPTPPQTDLGSLPDEHEGTRPGTRVVQTLPDGHPLVVDVPGDFRKRLADGGPTHTLSSLLYLARHPTDTALQSVDAEPDQLSLSRDRDSGIDDETTLQTAITTVHASPLVNGPNGRARLLLSCVSHLSIQCVNASGNAATLWIYADVDGDGLFTSVGESRSHPVNAESSPVITHDLSFARILEEGQTNYECVVPVRLRLSFDANPGPDGPASGGEVEDHLFTAAIQVSRWWPEPESDRTLAQRLTGTLVKNLANRLSAAAMSGRPGPHAGAVWRVGEHVFTQENPELPPALLDAFTSGRVPWLLTLPGTDGPEHFAGEFEIKEMPEYAAAVTGFSKPGLLEDEDGDGVINFAELAFGSDPAAPGKPAPSLPMQDSGGAQILLYLEHEPRPSTAGEPIVYEYLPQISHDLTNWITAESHPVPGGLPAPPAGYVWKSARAPAGSAPAFLRVNASPP